jgi:hypothetical protein
MHAHSMDLGILQQFHGNWLWTYIPPLVCGSSCYLFTKTSGYPRPLVTVRRPCIVFAIFFIF